MKTANYRSKFGHISPTVYFAKAMAFIRNERRITYFEVVVHVRT